MDPEQLQQRLLQQHNDNIIVSQQQQQVSSANGAESRLHFPSVKNNSTQQLSYTSSQSAKGNPAENQKHFYYIRHFADASRGSTKVLSGVNSTSSVPPLPSDNACRKPPSSPRELRALLPLHIFIERDYRTKHVGIQFEREMPMLLSRLRFPAEQYFNAVDRLNTIYAQLESVSCRTIFEFLFNCLTCYLCVPCTRSTYEKILSTADRTLADINNSWAEPSVQLSAKLCNPRERGFRFLELVVFELPPDAQDETVNDENAGIVSTVNPDNQRSALSTGGDGTISGS